MSLTDILFEQQLLSDLDYHFASFINNLATNSSSELMLAAALTSAFTQKKHTCLDLKQLAEQSIIKPEGEPLPEPFHQLQYPQLSLWLEALKSSGVIGCPGEKYPLIMDQDHRLYLYRYWQYEKEISQFIQHKLEQPFKLTEQGRLEEGLQRLFDASEYPDWQETAALISLLQPFSVISGGPGTGKTYTVIKILTLFIEQSFPSLPDIRLVAPTGKAAVRLQDSIKASLMSLNTSEEIRACIPTEVTTIHRLLGGRPGQVYFRYNQKNLLPCDVLVIDEASMVDLALMAKVIRALQPNTRLILLGDKDQLASVEAGSVLGDICFSQDNAFSESVLTHLKTLTRQNYNLPQPVSPIQDSVVILQKSYRFGDESGIGQLARAVNQNRPEEASQILISSTHPQTSWQELTTPQLSAFLKSEAFVHAQTLIELTAPTEAFKRLETYQILCVHRHDSFGVDMINQLIRHYLYQQGMIADLEGWYHGLPIMVTKNDAQMKLFNGDIGIILRDESQSLKAYFKTSQGEIRAVSPATLPEHESVYAMTVHKSQGSEFKKVQLILSEHLSPIMTRELIYTGITRARERVEIWGKTEVFHQAIAQEVKRSSGLRALIESNLKS